MLWLCQLGERRDFRNHFELYWPRFVRAERGLLDKTGCSQSLPNLHTASIFKYSTSSLTNCLWTNCKTSRLSVKFLQVYKPPQYVYYGVSKYSPIAGRPPTDVWCNLDVSVIYEAGLKAEQILVSRCSLSWLVYRRDMYLF